MKLINRILRDEAGATAIEYGLIAALIAVAAIIAMESLGEQLSSTFESTTTAMTPKAAGGGGGGTTP
jgi:pilus assembly protein Flp/PilA